MKPRVLVLLLGLLCLGAVPQNSASVSAEDITVLISGTTHAMLYPCHCQIQPDGGVVRRAAMVKKTRQKDPNTLVLDAGSFVAGGLMDEYTQNTQLDTRRSEVNIKAMELMQTDAAGIGDDEFNLGTKFLEQAAAGSRMAFVSANVGAGFIQPYVIKKIGDAMIGITALTPSVTAQKAQGLEVKDPAASAKKVVSEMRKKGADVIVVMSNLGEPFDAKMIRDVPGIDVLVVNAQRAKEEVSTVLASTVMVRTSWQGRRIAKLTFRTSRKGILNPKVEELRLDDTLEPDKQVAAVLPRCFSDRECQKEGLVGACQQAGTPGASCQFTEAAKVSLTVITAADCRTCNTDIVVNSLKKTFPGLTVTTEYYPAAKAKKMLETLELEHLPVYVFARDIEQDKAFESFKQNLEKKGEQYVMNAQVSGLAIFLDRQKQRGRLDLFMSLFDKDSAKLLDIVKEFNPQIHFLVSQQEGKFTSAAGLPEVEESLRSVCVKKHYPGFFYNYISCRARSSNSTWWEDCLSGVDREAVAKCARGEEGKQLLLENTDLNKELNIMRGPTYLMDNQEIFGSVSTPSKEELRKIITTP